MQNLRIRPEAFDAFRKHKTHGVLPIVPLAPVEEQPRRKLFVVGGRAYSSSSPKGALGPRFGIWRSRLFPIRMPLRKRRAMHIHAEQAKWRVGGIDFWVTIAAVAIAVLMIVAATQAQ